MICRVYTDKLNKIKDDIYNILLKKQLEGFPLSEALEEDKELCFKLSNKIIEKLVKHSTKQEILSILSSEHVIYNHFRFSADYAWANSVIAKIMSLQSDLEKYYKLSEEELKKYPNKEVERLKNLEDELQTYVNYDSVKKNS